MRQIALRGKREDNGEWVVGGSITQTKKKGIDEVHIIAAGETFSGKYDKNGNITELHDVTRYKVNLKTVGQFTGATDKNGKDIFEGDIICYNNLFLGVVEWSDEHYGFYVKGVNHNDYDYLGNFYSCLREVVGNIYDNPELLRGARK